ncbi:general stress protein [Pantoea tagorei]|uniref:general stress protein n=1 Tax=unclassified Pantoea TaxID=2630326 RepID=UPI001EF72D0B|nr:MULTISPECIES: general stress protein [unclassified Pantoea]MCG7366286.1 general stress protein [Pantoea sp. ACRSH]MCG7396850.1 general stress protein [Pantoea sp. ACRSC]
MQQRRGGAGNFAENPERAREAGRKGGKMSSGNFKYNRERAVEAGRAGGKLSRRTTGNTGE